MSIKCNTCVNHTRFSGPQSGDYLERWNAAPCATLGYKYKPRRKEGNRHALMCNISPADDIKLDSTLKALAKDRTISARIIDRLKPVQQ